MIQLVRKIYSPKIPAATLTLPWEKRIKSRLRVTLDDGADAGIFLKRGTIMHHQDLLSSDNGFIVKICAASEVLSIVTSDDPLQMARACYHLGNRHATVEIIPNQLRYQHDPVLDDMIMQLGLAVHIARAPFDPGVGVISAYGHSHA